MTESERNPLLWLRVRWMVVGIGVSIVILLVAGLFVGRAITDPNRPPGPPTEARTLPWGAIDLDELQIDPDSDLQESLMHSIVSEMKGRFDPDRDGRREYDLLALSGGGSNGAFGAGILCGWSESGTRPDFKVVTGVSTGALQATFAYLGPDYDHVLRDAYTGRDTGAIYARRSPLVGLYSDALYDTTPLRNLLAELITAEVLGAVADKHRAGHRLFVGTANMDTREFVVWDLGAIASSERRDALEHYRNVLLASAAVPVLFQPVLFEVEWEGETYYEMHVDGGAFAQIFFRGFLLDFEDAYEDAGVRPGELEAELYLIRNGPARDRFFRRQVKARSLAIAAESIEEQFELTMKLGLHRIYVLANRNNIGFHLAEIPADYTGDLNPLDFSPDKTKPLFDLGFELGAGGGEWKPAPSFLDPDEQFDKKAGGREAD